MSVLAWPRQRYNERVSICFGFFIPLVLRNKDTFKLCPVLAGFQFIVWRNRLVDGELQCISNDEPASNDVKRSDVNFTSVFGRPQDLKSRLLSM